MKRQRTIRALVTGGFVVAMVAGCSSTQDSADADRWQCPRTPDTGWPVTDRPGARDTLVPDSPSVGYECTYGGMSIKPALEGDTERLSPARTRELVIEFNTSPPMWGMSCPADPPQGRPVTFQKFYFGYADRTAVTVEVGRTNCPPAIRNGLTVRAIYPPSTSSPVPAP